MIRPVLKMGEELLLEKAMPVKAFGTPELRRLVADMWDTMGVEGGIGIAAPQVGVSLQVICFGTKESEEASGARRVPRTVLIRTRRRRDDERLGRLPLGAGASRQGCEAGCGPIQGG